MKNKTSKLLKTAHSIVTSVTGIDVPKTHKQKAMQKVSAIYSKIKEIETNIYKVLNAVDNHKTIN